MRQFRHSLAVALIGVLFFVLTGCSSGQYESAADTAASAPEAGMTREAAMQAPAGETAPPRTEMPRRIIYTGNVSLVSEDLDKAEEVLESLLKAFNAYVSNASKTGDRGATRVGTWTIRVPSARFDPFMKSLIDLGELDSSSRNATDVSEEFYDAQARLKNKRVEEQRLIELLRSATGKLQEVLTVEKELSRVREEIERIEGRLRFLTNQSDLSTVNLTIREVKNYQPEGPPSLMTKISRAFSGSLQAMQDLGTAALVLLAVLLPWIVLLALILLLIGLFVRRNAR